MEISSWQLGLTYAGCFLGAGFVSGQELWQFFGSFGFSGIWSLLLSVAILCVFGILILYISKKANISEMDKIVVRSDNKILLHISAYTQCFFIFGIVVIMIAGMGALINQISGMNVVAANLIMTIIVAVFAIFGLNGLVAVFSVSVPIIVVSTIIFASIAIYNCDTNLENSIEIQKNTMLPNWFVSAITYAAYNMMATIGIITPFGKKISSGKKIIIGIISGCIMLLVVALFIIISLSMHKSAVLTELPMLSIAKEVNPFFSYLYGMLLLIGMFGTALSSIVALETFFSGKARKIKEYRKSFVVILSLVAFFASLFGFGDLVGTVYPIFGYVSIVFLIMISEHFVYIKKQMKRK